MTSQHIRAGPTCPDQVRKDKSGMPQHTSEYKISQGHSMGYKITLKLNTIELEWLESRSAGPAPTNVGLQALRVQCDIPLNSLGLFQSRRPALPLKSDVTVSSSELSKPSALGVQCDIPLNSLGLFQSRRPALPLKSDVTVSSSELSKPSALGVQCDIPLNSLGLFQSRRPALPLKSDVTVSSSELSKHFALG
ncbi:hypothetical protein TSAR_006059 [Trichomalopsis sarcophagae]|uniref:Uncharacterized protein n=1 Tax=Trichomalopsis sarcophagae TaxID=543379 RepID=A0A232EDY7_9HYME|nr:hypothetical protein TSAR_006059 [Trichomalopsis sarcophagae]